MPINTSAGTVVFVTDQAPATFDDAGYTDLFDNGSPAPVQVGFVESLGSFGREYNIVTFIPLDERGTIKKKGSHNEGQLTMVCGLDETDAGQTMLRAAAISDDNYYFCIVKQDGTRYAMPGVVSTSKDNVDSVDAINKIEFTIELTLENATGVVKLST